MADNGNYYVCEYVWPGGHLAPVAGPYPTLAAAYTVMEQWEQQAAGDDEEMAIPPSYTVRALSNHRRKADGQPGQTDGR